MSQNNKNAFSLVEVLVAIGIMGILSVAVMSMISGQNRNIAALTEKLTAKDLEIQLKSVFLNENFCRCIFNGKYLNTTSTTPTLTTSITNIPTGYSNLTSCAALSTNIVPNPATSDKFAGSQMKPSSITLTPIVAQSAATYTATLNIAINPSSAITALKPIQTSFNITINPAGGTAAARPIVSCSTSAAAAPIVYAFIGWGSPALGGGWTGNVQTYINAKYCSLAVYGNDQSSGGGNACRMYANGTDSWRLESHGVSGWVQCRWLCVDYKGWYGGAVDEFYTFQ